MTVVARYMVGDEVVLDNCATVNDVRVAIANRHATFAPDVTVLTLSGTVLSDEERFDSPTTPTASTASTASTTSTVTVVLNDIPYDTDMWIKALLAHAKANDLLGAQRVIERGELDGESCGVALFIAVADECPPECVEVLLSCGADAQYEDGEDNALTCAAMQGRVDVGRLLLRLQDADISGALVCAAEAGHCDMVEMLLENTADVHHSDMLRRRTALFCAAELGHTGVVQLLLRANADVNGRDLNQRAALSYASSAEVAELLLRGGADVHHADVSNRTALFYTPAEVVRALIHAAANVNSVSHHGRTALSHAAEKGYGEIAQILIAARAEIGHVDKYKRTALFYAAEEGHASVVQMLVGSNHAGTHVSDCTSSNSDDAAGAAGVDLIPAPAIDHQDTLGRTALSHAAECGQEEVISALVAANADLNVASIHARSPLVYACAEGHVGVARILMSAGADLSGHNRRALLQASSRGHAEIVRVLLAAQANALDVVGGSTALCQAAETGATDVVALLLQAGADMHFVDREGNTALDYATVRGSMEVMSLLGAREIHSKKGII